VNHTLNDILKTRNILSTFAKKAAFNDTTLTQLLRYRRQIMLNKQQLFSFLRQQAVATVSVDEAV